MRASVCGKGQVYRQGGVRAEDACFLSACKAIQGMQLIREKRLRVPADPQRHPPGVDDCAEHRLVEQEITHPFTAQAWSGRHQCIYMGTSAKCRAHYTPCPCTHPIALVLAPDPCPCLTCSSNTAPGHSYCPHPCLSHPCMAHRPPDDDVNLQGNRRLGEQAAMNHAARVPVAGGVRCIVQKRLAQPTASSCYKNTIISVGLSYPAYSPLGPLSFRPS